MKIQHLAIIFLLIILPIDIVLGLYLDAQINTIRNKAIFDERLVSSVYDALEVYQSNSLVDTENDIVTSKMSNIEASASTFLTSLQSSFGYSGYKATVMQEYVPAVVYTMYDGYYIYSKFNNTVSQVNVNPYSTYSEAKDGDGTGAKTIEGIKSYVFYSCRYKRTKNGKKDDFVITYSLDNYITIQGMIQGNYENMSGYLIDGIHESGEVYTYDGIEYNKNDSSILSEYVGNNSYQYTKINGTKYYLDINNPSDSRDDKIFHIINGTKVYYPPYSEVTDSSFQKYKSAIEKNKSAYLYYKEAFEFTDYVIDKLGDLNASDAIYFDKNGKEQKIDFGNYNIFEDQTEDGIYIQDSNSNFNRHRSAVIRHSIETNLSAAIAGFSEFSDELEFAMPKISETDWEMIENNVSVIGFLQGIDMGTKKYNGYAAVANTTTTEFVDQNAIYLIAKTKDEDESYQYYRSNATDLPNLSSGFQGVFKIDFERHYIKNNNNGETIYYYPKSPSKSEIYSASYSSIINQTAVDTQYDDMYKYMRNLGNSGKDLKIKTAYYTALGRERFGSYKVSHDTDYSYFLKYY